MRTLFLILTVTLCSQPYAHEVQNTSAPNDFNVHCLMQGDESTNIDLSKKPNSNKMVFTETTTSESEVNKTNFSLYYSGFYLEHTFARKDIRHLSIDLLHPHKSDTFFLFGMTADKRGWLSTSVIDDTGRLKTTDMKLFKDCVSSIQIKPNYS